VIAVVGARELVVICLVLALLICLLLLGIFGEGKRRR